MIRYILTQPLLRIFFHNAVAFLQYSFAEAMDRGGRKTDKDIDDKAMMWIIIAVALIALCLVPVCVIVILALLGSVINNVFEDITYDL